MVESAIARASIAATKELTSQRAELVDSLRASTAATKELTSQRAEPVESVIERALLGHCVAEVVYDCR